MNIMTQEDKELLLKDLCARLPYGVKFLRESWNYEWDQEMSVIEVLEDIDKDGYINNTKVYDVGDIKPYLFPFSSMTGEQLFEVQEILGKNEIEIKNEFISIIDSDRNTISYSEILAILEWFNKNHFDYRGLIEKGLAINATNLSIY